MRTRANPLSSRRLLALLMVLILATVNLVIMIPTAAIANTEQQAVCGEWTVKAPMPTARLAAASSTMNGKMYVLGGSTGIELGNPVDTVEVYDPGTDSWGSMPSLPSPRAAAGEASYGDVVYIVGGNGNDVSGVVETNTVLVYNMLTGESNIDGYLNATRLRGDAAILNNTIYVAGGERSGVVLDSIEAYDLASKISTEVATMPAPRSTAGVVAIGSKIYIVGGYDNNGVAANTCWEYDPSSNTFADKSPMPLALAGGIKGATVYNNKLYIAGGFTGLPAYSNCVDAFMEYDPATDSWSVLAAMPTARFSASSQVLGDTLYAIGGHDAQSALNTNEAFCLGAGSPDGCNWQTKAPMPTAKSRMASAVVNGKIYLLGGDNYSGILNSVEMYDPATGSWSQMPPLSEPRAAGACVSQGDTIYLLGGAYQGIKDSVLAYNTVTGECAPIGSLSTPRFRAHAAILNDTIFVVGGWGPTGILDTVEAFYLGSNTSAVSATLPAPRQLAIVTAVGGKLYIMGGLDASGNPTNTCWEFDPSTGLWADKSPMPGSRAGMRASVTSNGEIIVAGGITSSGLPPTAWTTEIYAYNPMTDAWRTLCDIPTSRYAAANEIVDDVLYVLGGDDGQQAFYTNEALDLGAGSSGSCNWSTKAPMPTPRFAPASGVINGSIYVLGGSNRFDPPPRGALATVEKYNPATDTWEQLPPLIGERLAPGDATLGDIIYVVGGAQLFSVGAQANTVLAYDTRTSTCTVAGYIDTPRFLMDAEIINNKIYMFGGVAPGGVLLDSVEEFDLNTNASTYKRPLPAARSYTTVAGIGGKLYVLGGLDANSTATNTCWEYDPATDTYIEKSPMPLAGAFKRTVVYNNKIYLIGGMTNPGPTSIDGFPDIQEYDPATDTWRIVGALPSYRGGYTTEVVDGTLYVIGGRTDDQPLGLNEACTFGTPTEPVTPPSAPANIYATAGDSYVDLSWDPSEGATGYIVHYGAGPGGPYNTSVSAGSATSKSISLANGQPYYFVVTAFNSAGQSGYSPEAAAMPLAMPTISGPATSSDGANIRLFGTADPNVGVNIVEGNGTSVGFAIADSAGNWHVTVSLAIGIRLLSAEASVNGFVGPRSSSHRIIVSPVVPVVGDGLASQGGNTYNVNPETGITQVPTFAGSMLDIAVPVSGNPVAVSVEYLGTTYPLTDPDGDGIYTTSLPIGFIGWGTWTPVTISVLAGDGSVYEQLLMEVTLIDPSGYVYDAQTHARVVGATVTLYAADGAEWDPNPYNHLKHQINPQVTDDEGRYGWDVPEGGYYVVVTRDGYYAFTSEIVTVPPPVLDLNIPLTPKTATTLEYVGTEEVQYSDVATIAVKLTDAAGNPLAGKPVAIEVAPGDSAVRTTALDGTASRTVSALAGASTHNVKASFNEDDDYLGSNLTSTFAEVAESASLTYTGDVLAATTNGFTLKARIAGDNDGSAGDLLKISPASVKFYLSNTDGTVLAPIAATAFTSISSGSAVGNPETREFSVTTNLPVGVYNIVVKLEANDYYAAPDSAHALGVSYDPSGGFATGGGWLKPDIESTLPDGRANFGFVAKYKDSASTGNLEFQYQDANINLKSKTIDWLAISDKQAQFQGTATMNGQGLYTFRVMAKDNGEPGAGVDSFDIRIWQGTDTEAAPIHWAKNTIAGGNIVVRKK